MSRYGRAHWRPLAADPSHQGPMTRHDGIVLHTMVGSLESTDNLFRAAGYSGTESHFGVGADGTVYQWVDTARRADAHLEGTWRLLSIETADTGAPFAAWTGSNVPAWTEAQLDAIAGIIAWAAAEHDFPIEPLPDSRPERRGVGWHRQGCDPWRCTGGERWSESTGKVCPGDRRIAQVPEVLRRARSGRAGVDDLPSPEEFVAAAVTTDVSLKQAVREMHRDVVTLRREFTDFRAAEVERDRADDARTALRTRRVLDALDAIDTTTGMSAADFRALTREVLRTQLDAHRAGLT